MASDKNKRHLKYALRELGDGGKGLGVALRQIQNARQTLDGQNISSRDASFMATIILRNAYKIIGKELRAISKQTYLRKSDVVGKKDYTMSNDRALQWAKKEVNAFGRAANKITKDIRSVKDKSNKYREKFDKPRYGSNNKRILPSVRQFSIYAKEIGKLADELENLSDKLEKRMAQAGAGDIAFYRVRDKVWKELRGARMAHKDALRDVKLWTQRISYGQARKANGRVRKSASEMRSLNNKLKQVERNFAEAMWDIRNETATSLTKFKGRTSLEWLDYYLGYAIKVHNRMLDISRNMRDAATVAGGGKSYEKAVERANKVTSSMSADIKKAKTIIARYKKSKRKK